MCSSWRACRVFGSEGQRFSRKGRPNEKTCDSTPKTISNFKISRKHDGSSVVDHNGEGRGGREWNGVVGIEESMKRLADKSRGAAPWLRARVLSNFKTRFFDKLARTLRRWQGPDTFSFDYSRPWDVRPRFYASVRDRLEWIG